METIIKQMENLTASALKWWLNLTFEEKFYKTINWLSLEGRDTTERHPHRLTDDEITKVYLCYVSKKK